MDIFKVVGTAIACAVLAVTVRSYKPELGIQAALVGGVILLLMAVSELSKLFGVLSEAFAGFGLDDESISLAVRVTGIAYVGQLASDICRDSGETALASKTELCARLIIVSASLPMLVKLLSMLTKLVNDHL